MSALADMLTPQQWDNAWRRLRNDKAHWSPTVKSDTLSAHLLLHLLSLQQDLYSGRYRPGPLRSYEMKKASGGHRLIKAQYLRDKMAQRLALQVLEPIIEPSFHDDSYGYRPARGVAKALNRARERIWAGSHWLVDADIQSFFDSIPLRPLKRELRHWVADAQMRKLLDAWIDAGAHRRSLLRSPVGIAQGAVISPLLCNIYLHQLDQALAARHIPFVRFADDFLLFADNQKDAEAACAYADKQLQRLGLVLHPQKTRVVKAGPSVMFLGEKLPRYKPK